MWQILWVFGLLVGISNVHQVHSEHRHLSTVVKNYSWIDSGRENLAEHTGRVFCNSHIKVVHVYYENESSLIYSGSLLKVFNDCGVSYMVFR